MVTPTRGRGRSSTIGQTHQNAAFFQARRVLEKAISLRGRPGQRLEEVARIDQLLTRVLCCDANCTGESSRPGPSYSRAGQLRRALLSGWYWTREPDTTLGA